MSQHFYGQYSSYMQNNHHMMQSTSHHGRSRRNQRISSGHPNRQYRQPQPQVPMPSQVKSIEKATPVEIPSLAAFRIRFEAGRSFDLDDDMEFCPNLLTWDERQSMTSGSSDRSSLSSNSPETSPLQLQPQLNMPNLSLSSSSQPTHVSPPNNFSSNYTKLHQPSAIRSRNPIPIVNPDTRTRMSPPSSISPAMMGQTGHRRW